MSKLIKLQFKYLWLFRQLYLSIAVKKKKMRTGDQELEGRKAGCNFKQLVQSNPIKKGRFEKGFKRENELGTLQGHSQAKALRPGCA